MGMSNSAASVMVALYLLCGGLGGLLGGWIGDKVAARWPDHGRIAATQFSVIIGVPFALLIFKVCGFGLDSLEQLRCCRLRVSCGLVHGLQRGHVLGQ